ncbi:hypothetical protein F4782DRAFT_246367 [Xylaria castorea]|nr:hypothetical protein F4782DRAFT_246367 [Xylaria castorea]
MSNGTITNRGARVLCSSTCPVSHTESASSIKKKDGWPDIRGLNSLNASRNTWLTGDAIETSIAVYVRSLPDALQKMIGLGMLTLNASIWFMPSLAQYEKGRDLLQKAIATPARRLVKRFKENEYSIFPLCVNNNHWVLVVVHKNQVSSANDPSKKEWSRVVQAAVIDSYRSAAMADFVHSTLRKWLTSAAGFTFAPDYVKNVWVPLQHDQSSCGPRSYWHAKQILDRLLELHENGINYDGSLWTDLSGWFNEGFVRDEMIGRCAAAAVREMDYNARVAVEIVYKTKKFGDLGATRGWKTAKSMMEPEDMTGKKPESRPSSYQMNQFPGQGLDQLLPPADIHTPGYSGGTNTRNNNNKNNSAPPQGAPYVPPPQVPNQHRVAPGVSHSKRTPRKTAAKPVEPRSSSSRSPTFPIVTPPRNPLIPSLPGSGASVPIDLTSPTNNQQSDLTPGVGGLKFGSPMRRTSRSVIKSALPGPGPSSVRGPDFLASGSRDIPSALGASRLSPIVVDGGDAGGVRGSPQGYLPSPAKTSPAKRLPDDSNVTVTPNKRQKATPPIIRRNTRNTAAMPKGEKKPKPPPKGTPKGGRPKGGGPKRGAKGWYSSEDEDK